MYFLSMLQSDDNASFLRAARGGNLEKVLEYLKANTDINTCNAVSICTYVLLFSLVTELISFLCLFDNQIHT